jgi:beta-galactosidase/beta-glucuronidase
MHVPRPEYPRPQFVRADWLCLNGEWQFEVDAGDSGLERGLLERDLEQRIIVPFCPESRLSGIEHTDFMHAVWYRRTVSLPAEWHGRRVLLHMQAVDYDATVWVNGREVVRHRGGFTPFTGALHGTAAPGDTVTIVIRARDDYRVPQPRGKQAELYENNRCDYTRTTGIWQTIWLEPVPDCHLLRPRLTPDVAGSTLRLEQSLTENRGGYRVRATLRDSQGMITTAERAADADRTPCLTLAIPPERRHLWAPGTPHLYDVEIELLDDQGQTIDRASSYAGLRSVTTDGPAIMINGQTIFQRLVLDQGYYPDGVLTAPSDEALIRDIQLSLSAGFNGARLHQKVFEERFLYHADRIGYLVWGEFPDWGCAGYGPADNHQQPGATYITQWLEAIERDYSHPSVIGWCPLNETYQPITDRLTVLDDVTRGMFLAAKALDPTRPVLDTSGYAHRVQEADVYDCHDYEQDPAIFRDHYRRDNPSTGPAFVTSDKHLSGSIPYRGQPFFVSEFGGIWWNPQATPEENSWGYGERPTTLEAFYTRFAGLIGALLDDPTMFGYCYTQLTDVHQEQNGIYTFDRREKFDMTRLCQVQERHAAIEGETSKKGEY